MQTQIENNMITAHEYLITHTHDTPIEQIIIEFAKLHIEAIAQDTQFHNNPIEFVKKYHQHIK